jgi:hypothetical protein
MVQLYPRALGSLSVASYDSQGYGGGILSRLHTGYTIIYAYTHVDSVIQWRVNLLFFSYRVYFSNR